MAAAKQALRIQHHVKPSRFLSRSNTFKYSDLKVCLAPPEQLRLKPDVDALEFGKHFTDHMIKVTYHTTLGGWQNPIITPLENLSLHPAAKVFHYAIELFEGMKAFRGVDGKIRLFRPDKNMERMNLTAQRSGLPTFDNHEMVKVLCRLVQIEQEWIPHSESSSLYIRPTFIGIDPMLGVTASDSAMLYCICSPVGSYFSTGFKAVSLLADPQYTRAWPGGCGDKKMGANYGPTVHVQAEAQKKGLHQVLWLYGEEDELTEIGTMNVFAVIINDDGERELITPPLNGLILPGITRASILELAQEKVKATERTFTMKEVVSLLKKGRVLEMFGAGTACSVLPVGSIAYKDQMLKIPSVEQEDKLWHYFWNKLSSIQYGYEQHPWGVDIDTAVNDET